MPIDVDAALNVLATYLVHSTLLFGLAWLLTATVFRSRPGISEVLWRTALVGGLATTALHACGELPFVGSPGWTMPTLPTLLEATSPAVEAVTAAVPIAIPHVIESAVVAEPLWPQATLLTVGSLCSLAVLLLCGSCFGVRRRLRRRDEITDPSLTNTLRELERTAGLKRPLRLTRCPELASPIALGRPFLGFPPWGNTRGEIVLPIGIEERLSTAALRGVLAHEVAHHRWRDPLWRVIDRAIIAVAFIQPLHRIAARRLVELAEFRCDAWAVDATGSAESFADGLATVAAWLTGFNAHTQSPHATVAAMAVRPSALARRINHVLDRPAGKRVRLHPVTLICSILLGPALAPAMPHLGSETRAPDGAQTVKVTDVDMTEIDDSTQQLLTWIGEELRAIDGDLAHLHGVPNDTALLAVRQELKTRRDQLESHRAAIHRLTKNHGVTDVQGPDDRDTDTGPNPRSGR